MTTELFAPEPHVDLRSVRARTLMVTLTGFVDAGNAQGQVDRHLLDTLPHHKLGAFDVDELVDYRGQRPVMIFDADHFTEYQRPSIELHHLVDETGVPFLLLNGVEPDLKWERLVTEVIALLDQTMIEKVVLLGSVPMPIPHTRPVMVTKHASSTDLIPGHEPAFGRMAIGASFPSLLELRLSEGGRKVVGLTAHVPHYLAQSDFPDAAIALLAAFAQATGHAIPTTELAVRAGVTRAQIAAEVEASQEATGLVHQLEEQYDAFQEERPVRPLPASPEDLPTGDDIAAEAEAFLRAHGGDDPHPEK